MFFHSFTFNLSKSLYLKTHADVVYKKLTLNIKTHRLKVNRWRKIYHVNSNEEKAGVSILISDKADFTARKTIRDKERHCIMIKESVLQEDNNS